MGGKSLGRLTMPSWRNLISLSKPKTSWCSRAMWIASQDSKALARLIDRISGYALIPIYNLAVTKPDRSMDLAADYETARAEQDKATEASAANYAKKRSYNTEVKHFKEQTDEIKMWQKKNDLKVSDPVFSVSLNRLTLCRII
jgi:hypothetical protein